MTDRYNEVKLHGQNEKLDKETATIQKPKRNLSIKKYQNRTKELSKEFQK